MYIVARCFHSFDGWLSDVFVVIRFEFDPCTWREQVGLSYSSGLDVRVGTLPSTSFMCII